MSSAPAPIHRVPGETCIRCNGTGRSDFTPYKGRPNHADGRCGSCDGVGHYWREMSPAPLQSRNPNQEARYA